jgi:hypothetical protein
LLVHKIDRFAIVRARFDFALVRQLVFPIFFMIFMVPPDAAVLYGFGSVMSRASEPSPKKSLKKQKLC